MIKKQLYIKLIINVLKKLVIIVYINIKISLYHYIIIYICVFSNIIIMTLKKIDKKII